MDLKALFKKAPAEEETDREIKGTEIPDGLFVRCPSCRKGILAEELEKGGYICPRCGGAFRMPAEKRLEDLIEPGSFTEWFAGMSGQNPLRIKGYADKIRLLQDKTGLDEAVICGEAQIGRHRTVLMIMDSRFLTASMGAIVGEKITAGIERAVEERLPIVLFACSGGARMQEGILSLMQMAKTSAALKRHSDAGLLYLSVLTDPTMGGVTASFAMLGDVILAEPGALVGFAGPRVIEQTIRQKLPKGFQRSEFLLEHGFADRIVERERMKAEICRILDLHAGPSRILPEEIYVKPNLTGRARQKTPWERVLLARDKKRPTAADYISRLFDDFIELHGDRGYGDDPAILGGIGWFHGQPVTVIAQMKGKDTKENLERNFGMPKPEGYRKALRLMKQAEKFGRPILCFVDTPGAYCGMDAEERGQGEAIARNLYEMSALKTPILSVLIGEGGSGGALALAVADRVVMLENAIYSILSPEGFASILWKDAGEAQRAAKVMRLTSYDLLQMGVVEQIVAEPDSFTPENMDEVCRRLDTEFSAFMTETNRKGAEELVEARYQRFRSF